MSDTPSANAAQIEYWSGAGAKRWIEQQQVLDRALRPFSDRAFATAGAQPGERVLDVGCGCGATSLALAQQVGSAGSVVGLDVAQAMLERARERAAGLGQLRFVCADAAQYAGDAAFDLLFSRFGVMFFTDPLQAFARLQACLVPGGRMVFACWRARVDNPWGSEPMEAVRRAWPEAPQAIAETGPGPFAFADVEALGRLLVTAGFEAVRSEAFDAPVLFAEDDLEEAVAFAMMAGPAARMLVDASPAARERVRDELRRVLAPQRTPAGIALRGGSWIVSAHKPGAAQRCVSP
jgi:SAM-dependent methyltransferase